MTKNEYARYLQSDHWKDLRRRCLEAAGGKCALCVRERFLQAHHRIYRDSPYETQLKDLLALCVYCHARHHGKKVNRCPWIFSLYLVQRQNQRVRLLHRALGIALPQMRRRMPRL